MRTHATSVLNMELHHVLCGCLSKKFEDFCNPEQPEVCSVKFTIYRFVVDNELLNNHVENKRFKTNACFDRATNLGRRLAKSHAELSAMRAKFPEFDIAGKEMLVEQARPLSWSLAETAGGRAERSSLGASAHIM